MVDGGSAAAAAAAAVVYQAIVWKDRKIVAFLMNKFIRAAHPDVYCERRRKGQKTPSRIPTHEGVRGYQTNYNAVDVADRKMAAWSVERPSKRWYFRLFHYGLNVVVLNMYIIAAYWVNSKADGAEAYLKPNKRHGVTMTFMMHLAKQLMSHAVRMQTKDLDGKKAKWIGTAGTNPSASLHSDSRQSTTATTGASTPRTGGAATSGSAGSAGRPSGSEEKKVRVEGRKCRLHPVKTNNKQCQVCTRLAPPKPEWFKGKLDAWQKKCSSTSGVQYDAHCSMRMCPTCYSNHWDHDVRVIGTGAKYWRVAPTKR
jgi:hypothetical protein